MIPKSNDIRFEVTTKCNYNCIICPHGKLTRKIETMSFKLFKTLLDKTLDETDQYNTVSFPGMGEPLLDEALTEKIAYTREKKLIPLLLTNGSLLTIKKFKELERAGLESVRVSLYANDPQTYCNVHGIKDLKMFNAVMDNLVEIAEIKKHTKLLLTYNVINDVNSDAVKDWIDFWKNKVDLLEVWRPHNWVDGKNYRGIQKKQLKTCGRPLNGPLQIQVDGTVNMCCFDFDGKLLLDDLKTQTLKEIFSSEMYKKICKCHNSGNYKNSDLICENCDQRNSDKSGVMIYNSKFDIEERVKKLSTTYQKVISL